MTMVYLSYRLSHVPVTFPFEDFFPQLVKKVPRANVETDLSALNRKHGSGAKQR